MVHTFRGKTMKKEKPFSSRCWKDIPKAIPTGKVYETTEEERELCGKRFEKFLKEIGLLKETEDIKDFKV